MAAEVLAGLGAFKTMFDMAKGLKEMNDAAIRNGAVIELQEQILSAQAAQAALIERVRALEAEVASFEKWEADKQKYELKEIRPGVLVYARSTFGAAGNSVRKSNALALPCLRLFSAHTQERRAGFP
jgi:hypothetical protein